MPYEVKPATRTGVKPLIGLYGKSGGGKTLTALLVARGIVGDKGIVVMIDTERGRGSLFSDIVPGGYSVIEMDAPFTPQNYCEAFDAAEAAADIIIIDSMSHLWDGEGGIQDMQAAEFERMGGRDSCKMASWIKPKMEFRKFTHQRALRSRLPVICCLRGQEKTHHDKDERGKTVVVTDKFSTPIFDQRFIFELILCGEMVSRNGQGGYFMATKTTHPAIAKLLPREDEQMGVAFGQRLAAWCIGKSPGITEEALRASKLWKATEAKHGGDLKKFQQFLWDENHCPLEKTWDELNALQLGAIYAAVNK